MELATYADADGTNACPSIESLKRCVGSRRSTFRRLDELRQLGFLRDEGKSRFQGTTTRAVLLPNADDSEMTLADLRQQRDRRQQQQRDGQLRPARGTDPGGFVEWETASRHEFPELWRQLDAETLQ
jgi:hypothetical protein